MKRILLTFCCAVTTLGYVAAQSPAPQPSSGVLQTNEAMPAESRVQQLEALLMSLQQQLAQKDATIAQLLNENAQFRTTLLQQKTAEQTRTLVKKAGGNPEVDTWDYQTMKLVKGTPPK